MPDDIHELFNTKSKQEIIDFWGTDEKGYELYRDMHENGMETNRISLFNFLIIDKVSNLPIGECGFHTWNKMHRRAELFYLLRNDADKNKGIMTEAVREILNFGFSQLGLHRIEALVAVDNIPSVKILEKFGFTKEGTMREDYKVGERNEDSDCYSLLAREWKK